MSITVIPEPRLEADEFRQSLREKKLNTVKEPSFETALMEGSPFLASSSLNQR